MKKFSVRNENKKKKIRAKTDKMTDHFIMWYILK